MSYLSLPLYVLMPSRGKAGMTNYHIGPHRPKIAPHRTMANHNMPLISSNYLFCSCMQPVSRFCCILSCKQLTVCQYVKAKHQENTGVAPLKKDEILHSEAQDRAEILNKQFYSVFTKDDNEDTSHCLEPAWSHVSMTGRTQLKKCRNY